MHELTDRELCQALEYAKSIDEDAGRKIIEQFQLEQTGLGTNHIRHIPGRYRRGKSGNVLPVYGPVI